jgi:hypothetical protein
MKKNKIGRNDPCHCGSGKKYKKCCYRQKDDLDISNNNAPQIPISEAILKISEPLISKYPNRERITVIIEMAVAAWNMSLFPETAREDIESKIVEILPKEVDAIGIATIVEQMDMLIRRKIKYYKGIQFFIKNYNLSFSEDGQLTLDVNSVQVEG